MESRDLREDQQYPEIFVSLINDTLMYGDEQNPRSDQLVFDITLKQIDRHMKEIELNQDLPFKLTRIRGAEIENENTYKAICNHYSIPNAPFNPKLHTKVYFIETAGNAVVFTPIQLEKGVINVSVELLERDVTIPEIYDMYMGLSKMQLKDIKFVKFN
jgi:hypothetical protein